MCMYDGANVPLIYEITALTSTLLGIMGNLNLTYA